MYRPVTILLGFVPRRGSAGVRRPLFGLRPRRRHHARTGPSAQRGRPGDGARPRGCGRRIEARSRRPGRRPGRQHRRPGPSRLLCRRRSRGHPGDGLRRDARHRAGRVRRVRVPRADEADRGRGRRPRDRGWPGDRPRGGHRRGDHPIGVRTRRGSTQPDRRGRWAVPAPARIGRATAMDAILTGEPIDARRAFDLGLVSRLVEPGMPRREALRVAQQIVIVRLRSPCGPAGASSSRPRPSPTTGCGRSRTRLLDELLDLRGRQGGPARLRREAPGPMAGPLMDATPASTVAADAATRADRRAPTQRELEGASRRDRRHLGPGLRASAATTPRASRSCARSTASARAPSTTTSSRRRSSSPRSTTG